MEKHIRIAKELVKLAKALIAGDDELTLTLVIGLPGSGKSTYAKGIPGASHYEADMYFIDAQFCHL